MTPTRESVLESVLRNGNRRSVRLRFGLAALAGVAAFSFLSCDDASGPPEPGAASFSLLPRFESGVAGIIPLASVRVLLTRADNTTAFDSVFTIEPDQDSLDLGLKVVVRTANESFTLQMAFIGSGGDTVFRGGPIQVVANGGGGGGAPVPVELPVIYVGVGANAARVVIDTVVTGLITGDGLDVTATALDNAGNPIPGTPIGWSTLDAGRAQIPDAAVGHMTAGTERGIARIVAELLTGPRDTMGVRVQPLPTQIVAQSGASQTGVAGSALAQSLVTRVTAGDNQGVEGLTVQFVATAGALGAASAVTDANGDATVAWTLGTVAGSQSVTATTARLPSSTANFGATAVAGPPASVIVAPGVFTLTALGANQTFTAVVRDANNNVVTGATITWSSSDLAVATIGGTGVALAVANGTTTIRATAGTVSGTATLTVGQVPTSVTVSPQNITLLFFGATQLYTAVARDLNANVIVGATFTWGSGTPGVASINAAGLATALSNGSTVITATAGTASGTSTLTVAAAAIHWIAAGGGNWSNGANWAGGTVPGPLDSAEIDLPGTYTVTLDVNAQVRYLMVGAASGIQTFAQSGPNLTVDAGGVFRASAVYNLSGGTRAGAGEVTVANALNWTGGTLSGGAATRVFPGGTLAISGTGPKTLVAGHTLHNLGSATWSSTGPIEAGGGGILINSGTFDGQGDVALNHSQGGAAPVFTNSGTFTRSTGTGLFTIGGGFLNQGTATVQTGTLVLAGGGTSGGSFVVQPAGTLSFTGGTHLLLPASSITGGGDIVFAGGTVTVGGAYAVTGTSTEITGGTVEFSGASTSTTETLNISAGTRAGTGTLSVTGAMTWTGGTLTGSGITRVASGTLTIAGGAKVLSGGHALQNAGTATWSAGDIGAGGGAALANSGTLNVTGDLNFEHDQGGAVPAITNTGTIIRATATGPFSIAGAFNNNATLNVLTGNLVLGAGGTSTGSFAAAAGTFIDFEGGVHLIEAGSSVDGPGDILFSGGTTTVAGDYVNIGTTTISGGTANFSGANPATTADLDLSAGTRGGTGRLDVTGTMTWTGGTVTDAGTTSAIGLSMSGGVKTLTGGHTLESVEGGTWSAGNINAGGGAVLRTMGEFSLRADATFGFTEGGAAPVLANEGFLVRTLTTGSATIGATLNNTASLELQNGTLVLTGGGAFVGGTLTSSVAGNVIFGGGTFTFDAASPLTIQGDVVFAGGTTTILGDYQDTGASTTIAGGTVNFNGANPTTVENLQLTSGTLGGTGTVNVTNLFDWTGGTMTGAGTLVVTNLMTLSGGTKTLTGGRTFRNQGSGVWSAGNISGGQGAVMTNAAPSASIDVTGSGLSLLHDQGGDPPVLNNQAGATLTRSGVNDIAAIQAVSNNDGLVNIQLGAFQFEGGGTSGGTFSTASVDASLIFAGGTHTLTSTSSVLVAALAINAGDVTLEGSFDQTPGGNGFTHVNGGTLNFSGSSASVVEDLLVLAGTLGGTGTVEVIETLTWSGGTMAGSGTTQLTGSGSLVLSGAVKTLTGGRTLLNEGTAIWSAGDIHSGEGSNYQNSGSTDIQGNVSFLNNQGGAPPVFLNDGSLVRSIATGVAAIEARFEHSGSATVESGTLRLGGGGALATAVDVAAEGILEFGAGTFDLGNPIFLGGEGPVRLSGATLNVAPGNLLSFGALVMTAGTITGPGTVEINNVLTWGGGAMTGGGTTRLSDQGTGVFDGGTKTLSDRTFENCGQTTWTAGDISSGQGAVFHNVNCEVPATLDVQGDVTFANNLGGTRTVFNNDNVTLRRSTSTGTATIEVDIVNDGVVEVASGTLRLTGVLTNNSASLYTGAGTLDVAGDLTTSGDVFVETLRIGGALELSDNFGTLLTVFTGGEQTIPSLAYTNLRVEGSAQFDPGQSFTLGGSLSVAGDGLLLIGNALVDVAGDFVTSENGTFSMTDDAGSLTIGVDLVAGGGSTNGLLTGGLITIGRDFIQSGGSESFAASAGHFVEFAPNGETHNASFQNPGTGAGSSHWGDFSLQQSVQPELDLLSDAVALGQAQVGEEGSGPRIRGNGHRLTLAYPEFAGGTLDNLLLTWDGTLPSSNFGLIEQMNFTNIAATETAFTVVHPGGTFDFTSVDFGNFTPTTGNYISATDVTIEADPLTIHMRLSTPRDGSDHTQSAGGAIVNWSRMVFLRQPTSGLPNVTPFDTVVVRFVEPDGSPFAQNGTQVNLSIGSNPGGAALTGTTQLTLISNATDAVFTNLRMDQVANGYTLTAQAAGYVTRSSNAFDIVPGILFNGDSAAGLRSGIFHANGGKASSHIQTTPEGPTGQVYARTSPDRRRITYSARVVPTNRNQLHVTSAQGDTIAHLTSTGGAGDTSTFFPRYNATGQRLAFVCGNGVPGADQDVCTIADVTGSIVSLNGIGDGAGRRVVTDDVSGTLGGPGAVAWDPQNNDRLAVVRNADAGVPGVASTIYTVGYDGATPTTLAGPLLDPIDGAALRILELDWAPDGSFLAFSAITTDFIQLYRINRDGTGLTRLTNPGASEDRHPSISPDGTNIVFQRSISTGEGTRDVGFRIIGSTGAGERQLTVTQNLVSDTAIDDFTADWSPDGTQIVLVYPTASSRTSIYTVPSTGTNLNCTLAGCTPVSAPDRSDRQPSWRR